MARLRGSAARGSGSLRQAKTCGVLQADGVPESSNVQPGSAKAASSKAAFSEDTSAEAVETRSVDTKKACLGAGGGGRELRNEPVLVIADDGNRLAPRRVAGQFQNCRHTISGSIQKSPLRSSTPCRDGDVIWRERTVTYGWLPAARAGPAETGRFLLVLTHFSAAPSAVQRGPIPQS
jgi:hypothetical protein